MNSQRSKRTPRCPDCGLPPAACACAHFPRVRFATPIAIVRHVREKWKPTNTGRLWTRMAEGTLVLPCGARERWDPTPLADPSIDWRLLFPREGAPVLSPALKPSDGRRLGLVLLDGGWGRCVRLARRLPVINSLPLVALPPSPPSFWTVREQLRPEGRSTFEAALQAVGILEGPALLPPLRRAFAVVTARMLHLKGKLPSPDVPAAWNV